MSRPQTTAEELANSLTHGAGALIGLVALVGMLALTVGTGWMAPLAVGTYGLCLTGLFAASTVYHWAEAPGLKQRLQKLDHCAIYLLIAGTYTPFTLLAVGGKLGVAMLAVVWALAVVGIGLELWLHPRRERLALSFYLVMGWLVLAAPGPLFAGLPGLSFALLLVGGLLYTGGVWFYVRDRPWDHAIWHGFVLSGATSHALAVSVLVA